MKVSFVAMSERWILGVGVLIGFLWIRSRARALRDEEGASRKALYGIFFFLAPLLFAGKWAFKFLPFEPNANLLIEMLALASMFALTGLLFLRGPTRAP